MISLGKFLASPNRLEEASYLTAVGLLVEGIQAHSLDYNKEDHKRFCDDMFDLRGRMAPGMPVPELFVLIGEVIRSFEEYNRRTGGKLRAQTSELQAIVSTLTSAVAAMVFASDSSLVRLRQIQSQLEDTGNIEDLRQLKSSLGECLANMAAEIEEHRKQSASGMEMLAEGARGFNRSLAIAKWPMAPDPVTGLPARAQAEAAITRLLGDGRAGLVAILTLQRLRQVNARYGYEVGDGVLATLSAYLRSAVNPRDELYRWSGPAVLIVVSRSVPIEVIRRKIARLAAEVPAHEIMTRHRSVVIPASVDWLLFPVAGAVEDIVRQLDGFVDSRHSEEASAAGG